eukprot:g9499.t1
MRNSELPALHLGNSRGTGIVVDTSDTVWVRRHDVEENGMAGIHIMASKKLTFVGPLSSNEESGSAGQGFVGSQDGPQPIELIMESSTLVTFNDVYFLSANDPVMTVSADSSIAFNSCGFGQIATGTCVVQADDLSVVTTGDDDELTLEGNCFVMPQPRREPTSYVAGLLALRDEQTLSELSSDAWSFPKVVD